MNINILENKKIAILGFGVTGQNIFDILKDIYPIDIINNKEVDGYEVILQDNVNINDYDLLIKSPGIWPDIKLLQEFNGVVTNEIELTYLFIKENNLNTNIIGITGTNGKTSATSFIAQSLNTKYKAIACGNIGTSPLKEIVKDNTYDYLVMELSSYQLNDINVFQPHLAIILNLSLDHIEYHENYKNYINAKYNLIKNLEPERIIVTKQASNEIFKHLHIQINEVNHVDIESPLSENVIDCANTLLTKLRFSNNEIIDCFSNFVNLEHRFEVVLSEPFVAINDSKATNVEATNMALSKIDKPTYLVLGGEPKQEDYTKLKLDNKNLKEIIVYGELIDHIDCSSFTVIPKFEDSITYCIKKINKDECLLLSPACASYDQFDNFEQRGNKFKELLVGDNLWNI